MNALPLKTAFLVAIIGVAISGSRVSAAIPLAVPTFNCIGLCWKPSGASSTDICTVRYRKQGAALWNNALDLWYDDRPESRFTASDPVFQSQYKGWINSYRGSIVNLSPGTVYEVRLHLQSSAKDTVFTAATWPETFRIAKTVELPQSSGDSLLINQSGTASGYVLYTHASGKSAEIDVANKRSYCVGIADNVSYVIVHGLALKNGAFAGIRLLGNNHDIIIEECDISGWGRISPDAAFASRGWGEEQNAGIFCNRSTISRIVIQRNRIHNPRYGSNSWFEPVSGTHPEGPQCIAFQNDMQGNLVIRYNTFYSDSNRYFNDVIGGGENNSYAGWPNCDSDIYGNYIADCWDDGIESDGANRNVRIWGNFIEFTYMKISAAPVSIGPLYVWRNLSGVTRQKDSVGNSDVYPDGYGRAFHKTQGAEVGGELLGGRAYLFHNTVLQPPSTNPNRQYIPDQPGSHKVNQGGITKPWGCSSGISNNGCINYISRNNIFNLRSTDGPLFDKSDFSGSDLDYDLWYGNLPGISPVQEAHGINNQPVYDAANGLGRFFLASTSPGFDQGVRIPNFNDDFAGVAPDMGAHEAQAPAMEFGANGYVAGDSEKKTTRYAPHSDGRIDVAYGQQKKLKIRIQIPEAGTAVLRLFNLEGRLIGEHARAYPYAGVFGIAIDDLLRSRRSGEYIVTLQQNGKTTARLIVLVE